MLREIEDNMIASPSNVIEYADDRLACTLYRPGFYDFGPKSASHLELLCATFAIII